MILERLKALRGRIEEAAQRSGRDPARVALVAVAKRARLEDLRAVLRSGRVRDIGENRVQDAERRREALGADAGRGRWRFIGHLQSNKARSAVELFETFDAIDSLSLAVALDRHLAALSAKRPALVQIKLTDRETQSGIQPKELEPFLAALRKLSWLRPAGLMAIAPALDPVERVRPYFRLARELFDRHFAGGEGEDGPYLSLGMSRDFEIAVEEGANLVRVGTALFGEDLPQTPALTNKGGTE